jgi:EAL domain-containing protein (putative c-di-GMP-specific phosphodiesterase class I)/GGDEF domain-containing protein
MTTQKTGYRWKISRIVFAPLIFFVMILVMLGSAGAFWLQRGVQEKLVLPLLEREVDLVLVGFKSEFHTASLFTRHMTEQLETSAYPLNGDLNELSKVLEHAASTENGLEGSVKYDYVQFGSAEGDLISIASMDDGRLEYYIKDRAHADGAYHYDKRPDNADAHLLSKMQDYDPRTRPWYTSALSRCPVISPVYFSLGVDASWNASIVCEVERNGHAMGVLSVDVAPAHLTKILESAVAHSLISGVFILDDQDNVLLRAEELSPEQNAYFGRKEGEFKNFQFNREVLSQLATETSPLLDVDTGHGEFLLYQHSLGEAGIRNADLGRFRVLVVASKGEVYAIVNRLIFLVSIAIILTLLGTMLLVRLYRGSITTPLVRLKQQAEQVTFGVAISHNKFERLYGRHLVIDEIDALQGSVKGMAKNLVSLYQSLRNAVDTDQESGQFSPIGAANQLERVVNTHMTIVVLDINNYSNLLDAIKHTGIAQVWRALVEKLKLCWEGIPAERLTIYRYSESRMVFILVGEFFSHRQAMERLKQNTVLDLSTGTTETLRISYSVGVEHDIYSGTQAMVDGVYKAVLALRAGQTEAAAGFAVFELSMLEQEKRVQALLHAMDAALIQDEFLMYYQPICDLRSGAVHGVEALLRWKSPQFGMVSPAEFIPLAERSERIVLLGNWVLRRVARDMAALWRAGKLHADFTAHVNVSVRQLMQTHFTRDAYESVQEHALPPRLLTLELTESLLIDDGDYVARQFQELKQFGFGLCLDDFGTGYSSLSTLHKFSFDCLKLDRSFVIRSTESGPAGAVLPGIVAIAKSLQMECVAEGIELQEQADKLRAMGCEYVQGYLFARPMPLADLEAWLQNNAAQSHSVTE